MSRWNDVDDIIAEQKKYCFSCEDGEETTHCSVCFAKDIVSAIIYHPPSIDIVRCTECKWYDLVRHECTGEVNSTDNEGGADYRLNFYDDDFCSYGEREGE